MWRNHLPCSRWSAARHDLDVQGTEAKTTSETATGKRTAAGEVGTRKASLVITSCPSDLEREAVWAVDKGR